MFIKQIDLKHFRCFSNRSFQFDNKTVVIEGVNGVGKTTLLEALHYACYLRSFRTHNPGDLMQFEKQDFFIKIAFQDTDEYISHDLCIGYSKKKRSVKLNGKALQSYKELMSHYRTITLTEDDLGLIKLGPDVRRQFVDQGLALYDSSYVQLCKEHKVIVDNRNKLLQTQRVHYEMYELWTEQLLHKVSLIQSKRIAFLKQLEQEVVLLLERYFTYTIDIRFSYKPKKDGIETPHIHDFLKKHTTLFDMERRFGRSLFGAHLDDFAITFQGTHSRMFASRGQQKLIMLLIKIAQIQALKKERGIAILLLDDFMTDFDNERAHIVLDILADFHGQLIFTTPVKNSFLTEKLLSEGAQKIEVAI